MAQPDEDPGVFAAVTRPIERLAELVRSELFGERNVRPLSSDEIPLWRLAREHKVATILSPGILSRGEPAELVDEARYVWQLAALREVYYTKKCDELLELFSAHGIRAFPLKGVPLAREAYPKRGFRAFRDLDLLVPAERVADVHGLLSEHGFVSLRPNSPLRRAVATRGDPLDAARAGLDALSYEKDDLFLEIHTSVLPGDLLGTYPLDGVGSRPEGFTPEDFMAHLLIHTTRHHFLYGLRHLVDVAVWAPHVRSMEIVRERLERNGVFWLAWPAWALAARFFPEAVEPPPPAPMRPVETYTRRILERFERIPMDAIGLAGSPIPFILMKRNLGSAIRGHPGARSTQIGEATWIRRFFWELKRPFGLVWRHAPVVWNLLRMRLLFCAVRSPFRY